MEPGEGRRTLLFINQHYRPDLAATGQLLSDLAEYLVGHGYRVEVLCARGRYQSGRLKSPATERLGGVRVRRFWTPGAGRRRNVGRMADYLAFSAQVAGRMLFGRRPTLIVTLTTPPLLPALTGLIKRLRSVPFAIWSMDLHPEAEVAAGMIDRTGAAGRILSAAADVAYREADFVVVLGECMHRLVSARSVPDDRLHTIPVWSRREDVQPVAREQNPLARELSVSSGEFVVMYSGNAGIVHDFDAFLQAARMLQADGRVRYLFVGDGPRRAEIEAFALENGLTGLTYHDYFPRDRLSDSLSLGDVHFVSLRPEFEGIAVPAKLYGIMAAARPVIFLGPSSSSTARTILEAGCGAVVDPACEKDPGARIAAILEDWRNDPEERAAMGARGRALFEDRYERETCCEAWLDLLARWLATRAETRGA